MFTREVIVPAHVGGSHADLEPLLAGAAAHQYAERTLDESPPMRKDVGITRSERAGTVALSGAGNGVLSLGKAEEGYYWLVESLAAEVDGAGGTALTAGILALYHSAAGSSLSKLAGIDLAKSHAFLGLDNPQRVPNGAPVFVQAYGVTPFLLTLAVRIQIRVIPIEPS